MMEPLMRLLTKRAKAGRALASALCLVVLIVLIGGIGFSIVAKIVDEAKAFVYSIPNYLSDLGKVMDEAADRLNSLLLLIPEPVRDTLSDPMESVMPLVSSALGAGVKSGSWNVVANLPGALVNSILSLVSAFFFMKDRALIFNWCKERTPKWLSERLGVVRKGMAYAILGYFKAQLIMMSIVCCIVIVGLIIIQYPYALFLGLIIAVVDALPIFGSGAILWPWAAISFINGRFFPGVALLLIYAVVLVVRQTVEPRVLGSQIGIHPLVTLMSMYAGIRLFGILGIVVGPAVVITIKAIFEAQARQSAQLEPTAESGEDPGAGGNA
jgi:sporulation integral membrane protein YtvI